MNNENIRCTSDLIDFLAKCPTAFQAVDELSAMLEAEGFTHVHEGEQWDLQAKPDFFVTRNMSSIIAVRMPEGQPQSLMIAASHTDSPTFKIKANAENEVFGKYIRLNTECYSAGIFSTWFDRPLSAAGRAIVRHDGVISAKTVNIDRDLCVIPNVAIHMKRDLNDGYKINRAVDTVPLFGAVSAKGMFGKMIAEAAGVSEEELLSFDMYLYDRTGGRIWGAENEFFSSPRIDNLQCAYSTLQGFLSAQRSEHVIQVYASFDNEETGSATKQGAASTMLRDTLDRICEGLSLDLRTMLPSSLMLSADNGHAMHPNHPEYADKDNAPHMNGGVVIKYNASQKYTTDAISAALFTEICKKADVPVQTYANRSDIAGGGTLGSISNTKVALNTVDIGLAQLAMHSCYETGGTADTLYMQKAVKEFYETQIVSPKDGIYNIK